MFFYFKSEEAGKSADPEARGKNKKTAAVLAVLSGISLGISYSVKWTGFAAAALIFFAAARELYARSEGGRFKKLKKTAKKLGIIFVSSFFVYTAAFALHFSLLSAPGPGDPFLSKNFRDKPFTQKFIELNQKMYFYNSTIKSDFPFQSKWYNWPFNKKSIFYWQKENGENRKTALQEKLFSLTEELKEQPQNISRIEKDVKDAQKEIINWDKKREIWLTGNPSAFLFGILGVILAVLILILKLFFKKRFVFLRVARADVIFFLLLGWILNYIPFAFISRPLMLYHYFFPLIFSFILFGYIFILFAQKLPKKKFQIGAIIVFAAIIVLGFMAVAPLTYGLPFYDNGFFFGV